MLVIAVSLLVPLSGDKTDGDALPLIGAVEIEGFVMFPILLVEITELSLAGAPVNEELAILPELEELD